MKIESLKSEGYIKDAHTLRAFVSASNQQEVKDALAGKEILNVFTDNEEEQQLVESFEGFLYIYSIKETSAVGCYEVILSDVEPTLEYTIAQKVKEVEEYDTSSAVNSFSLAGNQMWLDKETRVGLMNSINIEQAAGKQNTVLWFDSVQYEIPIDLAIQMLNALELYALNSYNVTHSHIATVKALSTIEEVKEYNHTTGYPEKLVFNLSHE